LILRKIDNLLKSVLGDPVAVGYNSFIQFAKAGDVPLTVTGKKQLVDPGQKPEK
jgi:hypothetical protein